MSSQVTLVLATRNQGKIREFRRILDAISQGAINLVGLEEFPHTTDVVEPSPSPGDLEITDPVVKDLVVEEQVVEEAEPTPSPSPTPPHALLNQSMRIITPSQVMVDPRARTVFLPKIVYAGQGDLLVCASSSLGSFNTNFANTAPSEEKSSLEIASARINHHLSRRNYSHALV